MAELIDALIGAVAAKQYGNITRAQLLGLGLTPSDIKYRLSIGRLYPVFRGVYSVGHPPDTMLQRACAAVLACGPHAGLAGASAMTHLGFWKRWDLPFEVVVTQGNPRPRGITVHRPRSIASRDIRTHLGIRTTTPARTIFDLAPRLNDKQLARDVNNALHSRYLTRSALADLLARHPNHPSTKRLLYFVTTTGGPTLSDWERELPAFCRSQGLPEPLMSRRAASHTPDASWPNLGIVLELDSWEFHNTRVDFETDRDRDVDYLAADLIPIRITWERMINGADREGARLRKIAALRANWRRAA